MNSIQLRWTLLYLIIPLLISGCVNLNLPSESHITFQKRAWQQRRLGLIKIRRWDINGAFSIHRPKQSVIANYSWQQHNNKYMIKIASALDAYSAIIQGNPLYVTLKKSNREKFYARNPEQLMQQQLGWSLPVSNLSYWIRGLPAPGKYQAKFDTWGHLIDLRQNGWHVKFSHYWPMSNTVDVPQTLLLKRSNLTAKIVIKHW